MRGKGVMKAWNRWLDALEEMRKLRSAASGMLQVPPPFTPNQALPLHHPSAIAGGFQRAPTPSTRFTFSSLNLSPSDVPHLFPQAQLKRGFNTWAAYAEAQRQKTALGKRVLSSMKVHRARRRFPLTSPASPSLSPPSLPPPTLAPRHIPTPRTLPSPPSPRRDT